MVRCPTEIEFVRLLEGALSLDEAHRIEEHGSTCAACRARMEEVERATDEALLQDVRRVARQGEVPSVNADWFDAATGEALARYKVLNRIGAGGMGVVYEAEQQNPHRRVAIKVVKSVMISPALERRFAREVDVLARLEHPGIARVLEADTFEVHGEKRPFFAMELVEGLPIDDFVTLRQAGRRVRLELFLKVCEAVAHAHQKGVLHRDLKPSNILVTEAGQPKILDFGVARLVDPGEGEEAQSLQTQTGQLVGTLPFMSPEQVSGDPDAIDTRSDVYGLGLILFRLLCGRMPYDLEGKHAAELVRIVSEVEPRRLRFVDARLPRDLDTIVAKALEKDRERRYPSVDGLAEDVRRYLADEPITARPPSKLYQLGKFTRRNKGVVAGLTLAFLILIAGVVVSTDQARRARDAEAKARLEAQTEERVNQFMAHLLGSDDPQGQTRPVDYTIREALDEAEQWLDEDLAEEPLVEATVRVILGTLNMDRDRHEQALRHLHRALELREGELGPQDVKVAAASNALGAAYFQSGDAAEAERRFRHSLEVYAPFAGDPEIDKLIGTTYTNLGTIHTWGGDIEAAERELLMAIELHKRSMGEQDPQVARDLAVLGKVRQLQGDPEEVVRVMMEACAIHRASATPNTLAASRATAFLAQQLAELRRYEEAAELARETVSIRSQLRGPDDPEVGNARKELGLFLRWSGRLEESLEESQLAVNILRDHEAHLENYAAAVNYLGYVLRDLGRLEAALDAFYEALDLRTQLLGADDRLTRECEQRVVECEELLARE